MEKLEKSLQADLPVIIVYLDDLRRIEAHLQEFCATGQKSSIEIIGDDYKFDSVDDILTLRTKILTAIKISARCDGNTISVELRKQDSSIRASSNDLAARGTFESIKALLMERKIPLGFLLSQETMPALVAPLLFWLLIGRLLLPWLNVSLLFLAMICLGYLFWSMFRPFPRAQIVVSDRINAPNFWERNRDGILIGVVNLVLGIVLGACYNNWITSTKTTTSPAVVRQAVDPQKEPVAFASPSPTSNPAVAQNPN